MRLLQKGEKNFRFPLFIEQNQRFYRICQFDIFHKQKKADGGGLLPQLTLKVVRCFRNV
jgi:hypothetical protein